MIELDDIDKQKAVWQAGSIRCAECGNSAIGSILLLPYAARIDAVYLFHPACGHMEKRARRGWDVVYPSAAALTYLRLVEPEEDET